MFDKNKEVHVSTTKINMELFFKENYEHIHELFIDAISDLKSEYINLLTTENLSLNINPEEILAKAKKRDKGDIFFTGRKVMNMVDDLVTIALKQDGIFLYQ